jgi:integrase
MTTRIISTALQAKNAPAGVYAVKGATGFGFKKESDAPGVGSYTVRFRLGTKRPTMGLGAFSEISMADARKAAADAVALARKGINPIEARKREKAANLVAERAKKPIVFQEMVERFVKTRRWRHKYAVTTWLNPVKAYAFPVLAGLTLEEITINNVVTIAERAEKPSKEDVARGRTEPKYETARRVVSRVEAVLDAAIALSGKAIRNPADTRLIGKIHSLKRHGPRPNFRRIELDDAPMAFRALCEAREPGNRGVALEAWLFMIATAARPSEALQARWEEIDFDKRLWTLPAARAKSLREHVVPLSSLALDVLERRRSARTGDAIFGGQSGSPVGYANFARAPSEAGVSAGSPHSWRSIFRDWAGDVGRIDRDLAESALAHKLPATEASYRRGTAVEARRQPMEAYAHWLAGDAGADVIAFPTRAG